MPYRSAEQIEGHIFGFMYEMSLDLLIVARNSYTVLDILSDVGGIESIFVTGISLVLSILNYKYFDSYMVSHLYKLPGKEQFTPIKTGNVKLFCIDLLPNWLTCCKLSAR